VLNEVLCEVLEEVLDEVLLDELTGASLILRAPLIPLLARGLLSFCFI
jgi:hypothetical protein